MARLERRVLILENVPTDAELIELQLHKSGVPMAVRRAGTEELFSKAYADFKPDLVIADYAVPRFDLPAALEKARNDPRHVPWIVVSSANNEEVAVQCMRLGATDYVAKKNITRLASAAKTLLEGSGGRTEIATAPTDQPAVEKPPPGSAADDFFRRIVEHIRDLVAVVDREGRRLYNNPAYKEILDDPESLKGTDSFIDVHPEDRETIKRAFHESLRTGQGKRLEYRLLDQHGDPHTMESRSTVLAGAEGKPEGLVLVTRDISARKQAESAFQNLMAGTSAVTGDPYFRNLVRHLAHALDVHYALVSECVDRSRRRVRAIAYWANEQWVAPFEYDVEHTTCEKVLKDCTMCYYPENVQELFPRENALVAMHAVSYLGLPLFNGAGDVIGHMFVMDNKPLKDFQRTKFILSVVAARTALELERKSSLALLQASEARYRSILESIGDAIALTDAQDIITYVNASMVRLSGYSRGELLGKLASTLLLPKEEWETLQERNRERLKGASEKYESKMKRKDGSVFRALFDAFPYRDENGDIRGTLAIVTPIDQ